MTPATLILLAKVLGAAALVAVAITGVRGCQEHYRDQGREEVLTQWQTERLEAQRQAETTRANREREERSKEQTMARAAEENARAQAQRDHDFERRDADLQRRADGLRSAIASADATSRTRRAERTCPAADAEADDAAAARALLGSCAGRYRELAKDAERLVDQVMGLQDHVVVVQPEAAVIPNAGDVP